MTNLPVKIDVLVVANTLLGGCESRDFGFGKENLPRFEYCSEGVKCSNFATKLRIKQ